MLGIQQPRTLLLTFLVAISILAKQSDSTESSGSTSFDSLIASQCVSRCLSLYPWKLLNNSHTASSGASASHNDRKHRSNLFRHRRVSDSFFADEFIYIYVFLLTFFVSLDFHIICQMFKFSWMWGLLFIKEIRELSFLQFS